MRRVLGFITLSHFGFLKLYANGLGQRMFMHFFSIEFRANIFILMDIMIFHIIIQKIISLVFIIGFPFSLIFISHFQNPIIFINDFSSSIFNEFSIINISHFSSSLIFINHFFHPISIP